MNPANDMGYQCCFCSKTISPEQEQSAVMLIGQNFADWRDEVAEPRAQSFWAHFLCLQSNWTGSYPWEAEGLFEEQET
jgi:hypothetical protein